ELRRRGCNPVGGNLGGRLLANAPRHTSRSHGGSALRVTHGSRRATTKDENGPRHLCFVFNAIGSYFHRSNSWLSESHNEGGKWTQAPMLCFQRDRQLFS